MRAKCLEEKICTLYSALRPGSSEKAHSAPSEEARACLNRALTPCDQLRAEATTILLKMVASFWISTAVWSRQWDPGPHSSWHLLLVIQKPKQGQNCKSIQKYSHLFFTWETDLLLWLWLKSNYLSSPYFFSPACLLGWCGKLSDPSAKWQRQAWAFSQEMTLSSLGSPSKAFQGCSWLHTKWLKEEYVAK